MTTDTQVKMKRVKVSYQMVCDQYCSMEGYFNVPLSVPDDEVEGWINTNLDRDDIMEEECVDSESGDWNNDPGDEEFTVEEEEE